MACTRIRLGLILGRSTIEASGGTGEGRCFGGYLVGFISNYVRMIRVPVSDYNPHRFCPQLVCPSMMAQFFGIDNYATKYYSNGMKRILETRTFSRWLRRTELQDKMLLKAVEEMENGLVDADLGGGVFKKRIALPGRGKRGGVRTLIATNRADRWIFIYGFEKNEKDNITPPELVFLQGIAHDLLGCSEETLLNAIAQGELEEIRHERT